jgi:hypothetical protein
VEKKGKQRRFTQCPQSNEFDDELLSPSFGRKQTQRTQKIITQRRKDAKEKDRDEMNSLRLA